ncbi:MAG: tetratricopeptide repeat protein [Granulosicoccus sp.]
MNRLNQVLNVRTSVAAQKPDSWIHAEQLARAYLNRAKLSGEFSDYVASQKILKKTFELSGERAGPVLTRAMLNFSIHRLPDVEADLVAAESALLVDELTVQTISGIRGDVLLYTGHYSQAKDLYDQLESSDPNVTTATRLAHYHTNTGNHAAAERWLKKAEQRVKGRSSYLRAWLKLQLGILSLERGRLDDALSYYEKGSAIFPGFWLIEEHIAEIDALQGRDRKAEADYRNLIERTGSPLFMVALADILQARPEIDDQLESAMWRERADNRYGLMIEKMPELISGHALGHFLESGDGKQALQLAKHNYQLRPGGEAALLLVQAHAALGQLTQANTLLVSLLHSPYRSADLYATASVLYRHHGDAEKADEYDTLAFAVNPLSSSGLDWLRDKLKEAVH